MRSTPIVSVLWSRRLRLALLPIPLLAGLRAQTVATKPAEETIVLTPFSVDATKDVGFVAASALAGGRLATDLKDTPAAYSVLTRDFIDALNLTTLTSAQNWTTGFNQIEDDGRQNQFGSGESGRRTFRGVAGNRQTIEFFPVFYDYDSYNLERFDFARGPNSILFGSGSMGGTANGLYKRARSDKAFRELRLSVGSWANYRATFDLNQPVNRQLALRGNLLWEDNKTWRDVEYFKKKAATIAGSYKPWESGEFRVTADKGELHRNASVTTLGDRLSGWDGITVYSGPLATLPTDANARGVTRYGANQFVWSPGVSNEAIVNYENFAFTQGGNAAATVPIGGRLVNGATAGYADAPLLNAVNRPSDAFSKVLAGAPQFYIPGREFTTSHAGDTWRSYYQNYLLSFDQKVGEHLFLGASGSYAYGINKTDYTVVRGLNNIYIDINRTLPTGATNPNFLKPYEQSTRDYDEVSNYSNNYRLNAALVFNDTQLGKYRLGDFRLNLELGSNHDQFRREKYRYMIQDSTVASRDWINQIVQYRYYWGGSNAFPDLGTASVINPITGTTRTLPVGMAIDVGRPGESVRTKNNFDYQQAAFSAKLLNGRLNLLAAMRRDDYESITDQLLLRGDWAASWNGTERIYRPRPPADYLSLQPTRPRTNNVPNPANLGTRYQDDYSLPTISGNITTYSTGGVLHLIRGLSGFYNRAETWTPPSQDLRINGQRFLPVTSEGRDAGLRLELLQNRFIFSVARYQSNQDNLAVGTGTGTGGLSSSLPNAINAIVNANAVGDNSATGMNTRGLGLVPSNYSDTARRKSKGWEIELTANLTSAWRVLGNLTFQNAAQGDGYADTRAFLSANDTLLRQIVGDAGITVDANGNITASRTDRSSDADGAASAYAQLRAAYVNLTPADQKVARLAERVGNIFTDYTFQEGWLKRVRVGGGVNYRGKEVIGYRGGDLLASGSDDPAVSALTPVYRPSYSLVTGVIGYSFKVKNRFPVQLDLTVSNLLNEDVPLSYNTVQRPPNGDITTLARVATPSQYSYITPRSYSLTATVKF
jgi:outer membrane receptor protein involved in Fe transport